MRRILVNGRRRLAGTPTRKREARFAPPVGGRCSCPPFLESVAESVAFPPVSACSRIWSVSVPPSLRSQALAEVGSGVLPREDKATAMRVLSLSGQPSASRSGSAVSTLIWKVFGLRRYRPGRLVGGAAMTNAGSLAGMWRCISQHVFAIVMARSGGLLSTLRPMAPSIPTREGSRERPWSEGSPEVMGRGKG
jgi:hypothetical protein